MRKKDRGGRPAVDNPRNCAMITRVTHMELLTVKSFCRNRGYKVSDMMREAVWRFMREEGYLDGQEG